MRQHYVCVDFCLLQNSRLSKNNINSTKLDGECIPHQYRNSTWIGPGPSGVEVVQVESVLVRSTCLDEQISFAPKPWIGPGSE